VGLGDEIRAALGDLPGLSLEELPGGVVVAGWRTADVEERVAMRESGELLELITGVCLETECELRRVLLGAAHLHGGCAALIDGRIVLRYSLPRDRRDPAWLRRIATSLSAAARRFARFLAKDGSDEPAVFTHYVG
jgi:hypothetical protein